MAWGARGSAKPLPDVATAARSLDSTWGSQPTGSHENEKFPVKAPGGPAALMGDKVVGRLDVGRRHSPAASFSTAPRLALNVGWSQPPLAASWPGP